MSDQFIGEIRIFPYNFAPRNWAFCNGQLISIAQNTALFSLLGTNYGGNGTSTFALPNFQDSAPVHAGSGPGPGLQQWFIGETQGTSTVTLLLTQMAAHNHGFLASTTQASTATSSGNQLSNAFQGGLLSAEQGLIYSTAAPAQSLAPNATGTTGGNQPHNNMMPYLGLNFCIALNGIFPARN
jgi:microcystin-dependent protein